MFLATYHRCRHDIEVCNGHCAQYGCEWGIERTGPLAFGKKEEAIFWPRNRQHLRLRSDRRGRWQGSERIVSIAMKARKYSNTHEPSWSALRRGCSSAKCWMPTSSFADEGKAVPEKPRTPPAVPAKGAQRQTQSEYGRNCGPRLGLRAEIARLKR